MIRVEAGMTTARFTRLIGVPERSYRRWQQRQRLGRPGDGPWPTPAADPIEPGPIAPAGAVPPWGRPAGAAGPPRGGGGAPAAAASACRSAPAPRSAA